MSDRKELVKQMREIWARLAKNEIYFEHEITDEDLPIGTSKIGGDPDVPQGFVWPTTKNPNDSSRPIAFLMQINLAETAPFDKDNLLPKSGLLSFFYDYEDLPWGGDPEEFSGWKVLYFEDAANLTRVQTPKEVLDADANIFQESVTIGNRLSIPDPYDEIASEGNELLDEYAEEAEDEDEQEMTDLYVEIAEELGYEGEHADDEVKLFGYPVLIQNPMEEEIAEMASEMFEDVSDDPSAWTLLLQISLWQKVEGQTDRMFGDVGSVYFWIAKDDLQKKRFDRVMLQMQCY